MKSFEKWLLERKEVPLYHGTTTGPDNATLQSFKSQGIRPDMASGYGQGKGFYNYSDKLAAIQHANALASGDQGFRKFSSPTDHKVEPLVVSHKANLNPRDYELDKEVQSEDFQKFLISNASTINSFLKSNRVVIQPNEQGGTFVSNLTLYGMYDHPNGVGFWTEDPTNLDMQKVSLGDDTNIFIQKNNVHDAADLNTILQALLRDIPELASRYKSFVRSIMKRASEGRAASRAYKYVGKQNIKPSSLTVGGQNGWQEA